MAEVQTDCDHRVGGDGGANCIEEEDDEMIFEKIIVRSTFNIPSHTYKAINFQPRNTSSMFESKDQLYKSHLVKECGSEQRSR